MSNPTLPKKVVVLPIDIKVVEVTAGGVEGAVPDWSKEASQSVFKAVSAAIPSSGEVKEVAAPRFSGASAANFDEHLALYKLVVNTAGKIPWQHKAKRFDYGIGSGLRAVAEQTDADAAIMVYGRDYASTAGRKARAVAWQHTDRQHLHRSGAAAGPFLHPRRRGRSSHRRSAVDEQRVPRGQHQSARSGRCRQDGRRRVRMVSGHREIPRGVLEIGGLAQFLGSNRR
jgi:hypothetical protein